MEAKETAIKKSMGSWKPNQHLSNLAVLWYEESELATKRLFPVVEVDLPSGYYYEFSKGDLARDNVGLKPTYGSVAPALFGIKDNTFNCKVYQVLIGIDKLMMKPYEREGIIGIERHHTKKAAEQLALHQELDFASKFFKSGVWGNEWQGATTANVAQKKFLKFDNEKADPIALMDSLSVGVKQVGRRRPNKLALGVETFAALKNNPSVKERIKYSGSQVNPAVVNENVLAQLFGVEQVVVCDATYNAAQYGTAEDMQFVCDSKGALLFYAPKEPRIDEPSAIYSFQWRLDNNNYIAIETHDLQDATHTLQIEGLIAYDMKKTADDLGVYLSNCVG